jgi:cardiolipin synthase
MEYGHWRWALLIFVVAGLTDVLDGLLARVLRQQTDIGAYLDPIADKLLLTSAFILLSVKGQVEWWLTILVLSRDVLIIATVTIVVLASDYRNFPPSLYGKINTVTQILAVLAVMAGQVVRWPALDSAAKVLLYLTAATTVVSGVHYIFSIAHRLRAHPSAGTPGSAP